MRSWQVEGLREIIGHSIDRLRSGRRTGVAPYSLYETVNTLKNSKITGAGTGGLHLSIVFKAMYWTTGAVPTIHIKSKCFGQRMHEGNVKYYRMKVMRIVHSDYIISK